MSRPFPSYFGEILQGLHAAFRDPRLQACGGPVRGPESQPGKHRRSERARSRRALRSVNAVAPLSILESGRTANMRERCQDWYDKEYYTNSTRDDPDAPSGGGV